jgi:hypothetical protein
MENKKYIESIGQAYQQVQEKLKGGQKKLDKDGDGDIDGTDFAMMRKKKKMDEAKVECPKCKGEGCDHCDGKGYHMQKDEQGDCSSGRKTRKEDEDIVMNPKKKKDKGEKATNADSNMAQEDVNMNEITDEQELAMIRKVQRHHQLRKRQAAAIKKRKDIKAKKKAAAAAAARADMDRKRPDGEFIRRKESTNEDTKWPIYKRLMEKNVVNQNAVPPEQMIPADKKLKDDTADTVNQSQDHISAAAAAWIKDHDGNQVPADAVDAAKVVAKNQQDLMRTVPNQAKDEVNKKAAKAETMHKVEEK